MNGENDPCVVLTEEVLLRLNEFEWLNTAAVAATPPNEAIVIIHPLPPIFNAIDAAVHATAATVEILGCHLTDLNANLPVPGQAYS